MEKENKHSKFAITSTDVNYLDQNGVSKILGFGTSGVFWKEVLSYREEHRMNMGFRRINGSPLTLTVTPVLRGKWENASDDIAKAAAEFNRRLSEKERKEARKILFFPMLKAAATFEKSDVSDMSLKAMLNGTYGENNESHRNVLNYLATIDAYSEKAPVDADDDFLAEAYMKLTGQDELTSFYRESDSPFGRPQSFYYNSNYDYERAPDGHVSEFMDPFLAFVGDNNLPPFAIFAISLFYIPYIAPFSSHNKTTALVIAKEYLASIYGKEVFYLPFDELLLNSSKGYQEAIKNVRSSGDLTYFVDYTLSKLEKTLGNVKEAVDNAKISVYSPEYNQLSEEEKAIAEEEALAQPEPPKNEQLTLDSIFGEEEAEEKTEPIEEIATKEEPTPEEKTVSSEPSVEKESKTTVKPSATITEEEIKASSLASKTLAFEPDILTEKEAKEYMRYLLETNPNISKKQASFLSTHCTPGRFYSIQQFKNHAHCVYETARTSMDKLVVEGYYEKMQIKNKFVYTPKKRS